MGKRLVEAGPSVFYLAVILACFSFVGRTVPCARCLVGFLELKYNRIWRQAGFLKVPLGEKLHRRINRVGERKKMKKVDWTRWKRAKHFQYFKGLDFPHFNVTAHVELTDFLPAIRERKESFFLCMVYTVAKVANEIPEFRLRIRGDEVVEHETVDPSFTIMTQEGIFDFLEVPYVNELSVFLAKAREMKEAAEMGQRVKPQERDDVIYMTSLPWVSFTSIMHPVHLSPCDSIPRFAWGKYFEENGKIKLPFSVQAHHALMDGQHIGQYFMRLQEKLNDFHLE